MEALVLMVCVGEGCTWYVEGVNNKFITFHSTSTRNPSAHSNSQSQDIFRPI